MTYYGQPDAGAYGDDPYGGGHAYGQQGGYDSSYGQPVSGPVYHQPVTGQPDYQPVTGQTDYQLDYQPVTGQPDYQPVTGQPDYHPVTGQPDYQPVTGQPDYGSQPNYNSYATGSGMPPPAFPPAPPRKSNAGLIIGILGGAIAIMFVIGLGALLLVNGDNNGGPSASPTEVVDAFMTALRDGEYESLSSYVCEAQNSQESEYSPSTLDTLLSGVTLTWDPPTEVSNDGHNAEVTVDITFTIVGFSQEFTWEFDLVQEDGWKICGLNTDGLA